MDQVLHWAHSSHLEDIIGYVASALVLATFSMRSMRSLRVTAIASNFAFIAYAAIDHLPPIWILHSILLPMNLMRLAQIAQGNVHRDRGFIRCLNSAVAGGIFRARNQAVAAFSGRVRSSG